MVTDVGSRSSPGSASASNAGVSGRRAFLGLFEEVGTAWSILPCSEIWGSTVDGVVLCASGGGCETRLSCDTDGCVEVPRGRALVTGRNTVPPFSMYCVEHLLKNNYKPENSRTRVLMFRWMLRRVLRYGRDPEGVAQQGQTNTL